MSNPDLREHIAVSSPGNEAHSTPCAAASPQLCTYAAKLIRMTLLRHFSDSDEPRHLSSLSNYYPFSPWGLLLHVIANSDLVADFETSIIAFP
ncbi:Protein CBG01076 [Trichuris trichiura]|uniref:Protein CBG01076 n=1 Tax=Trichuris trichiura TaxID=36087 RepID=A0A077ZQT8_TRITR|nr:Protein CBG01076 [Trichuris trichiura]